MLIFGGMGFALTYSTAPNINTSALYGTAMIGITVYLFFYIIFFGLHTVKWIFINATLGIFGIYSEIRFYLNLFDKNISDFPWHAHIIPFTYYVLYTFMIHRAVLTFSGANNNPKRKKVVDIAYICISVIIYFIIYLYG